MIKAVIFDCFGVLAESSYNNFYKTYLLDKPELEKEIRALDHLSNKGLMRHMDFYRKVASLTHMQLEEVQAAMNQYPANLELFEYIKKRLKPQYKIGFLSNVASDMMDQLFTEQQQSLFDDIILSFQVQLVKPDPSIFKLSAKRLGVEPNECVFIDDLDVYCEAAKRIGMKTVHYTSVTDLKQSLRKLLV